MTKTEALKMLADIRRLSKYWVPDKAIVRFLDDLDFDLRFGLQHTVDDITAQTLRRIYATAKEHEL
jgi:hypothetical protein